MYTDNGTQIMTSDEIEALLKQPLRTIPDRPGRWAYVRAADQKPIVYWVRQLGIGFGTDETVLQVVRADDMLDAVFADTRPEDLIAIDTDTGKPMGTWGVRLGDIPNNRIDVPGF
jgi:hypothetical protein